MKKITLLSFLLAMLTFGAIGQGTSVERRQISDFNNRNATTIRVKENDRITEMKNGKFSNSMVEDCYVKMTPMSNDTSASEINFSKSIDPTLEVSSVIENCFGWGVGIFAEDGSQQMFTQRNEISFRYGDIDPGQPYFKSATFDFVDDNKNVTKTVTLKVPDTTQVITVLKQFSKSVFNSDSKFEFMVQAHSFRGPMGSGPSTCRDTLYVINEDGVILHRFGSVSGANITIDKKGNTVIRKLELYSVYYEGMHKNQEVNIYNPRTLALEHTFSTPNNMLTYSEGSPFSYVKIDDVAYYYRGHYEKPFMKPDSDPRNPTPEENNKYVIKLYDPTSYELVKEIKLNIIGEESGKWCMVNYGNFSGNGMYSGSMKYDLSKSIFNSDDKFEILYGVNIYDPLNDKGELLYYLVDEDNNIIKKIPIPVSYNPIKMGNIIGECDQYALLSGSGEGVSNIIFMDMPSFDIVYDFPAVYEDELLSLGFDRVPAKDGYNFVFGLGWGEKIDNFMYGRIAYYNKEGKQVKLDKIKLSDKTVQGFSPIITPEMLTPYWADTDNENEYAYFTGIFINPEIPTSFFRVSDDNGEFSYSWDSHEQYGSLRGAGVRSDSYGNLKELYVSFWPFKEPSGSNSLSTLFYKLPLKSFTNGGSGTEEDPYIITNAGELNAIRDNLEAHFVLANDIDLKGFSTIDGKGWVPIGTTQKPFKGTLDGNNHSIKNMYMERGEASIGFFCTTSMATIKNLSLIDVEMRGTNTSSVVGAIVADAGNSTIENCHVTGQLYGKNVGGVIGKTSQKSLIKMCSFEGNIEGGNCGGITTSVINSKVILSYSKGTIKGAVGVGGIAASVGNNGHIDNCYSSADVTGTGSTGGVVGTNKFSVNRTYATGNVTVGGGQYSARAGGIAGSASGSMVGDAGLKNSVGMNPLVTAPSEFGRIAGENNNCNLENNYSLPTMKIGVAGSEATVTSSDASAIDGADKALVDMTQEFYEGINWKFGNDSINPWRMNEQYPRLWYEFIVRGVSLNETEVTIDRGTTFQLTADIMPSTAENKGLLWLSSDSKVISVDDKGLVTAVGKGEATIRVITDDGDFESICKFTVIVSVKSITLDKTEAELAKGKNFKLNATINPADANNMNINWFSSNEAIATVSPTGFVIGIKKGDVVITAKTVDGGFTATCNVKVIIGTTSVILNQTSINIMPSETFQLVASVRPTDATYKEVTWSSSDNSIATVSETGVVTAIAKGNAVITVTTVEGGFTATCDVRVGLVSVNEVDAENINIFYANEQIVIKSNLEIVEINVFDISGKRVYYGQEMAIPTFSWNKGVYIVKTIDIDKTSRINKVLVK